jgi:uncharacterized protein (DUF433 family)
MASALVSTRDDALKSIHRYKNAAKTNARVRERAGYVQSWYARKDPSGSWQFAPSKFAGYRDATAEDYLANSGIGGERDGRQTERVLATWFTVARAGTRLERELTDALRQFLAELGQAPNARARISVLNSDADVAAPAAAKDLLSRITSDPRVCGGRPCIIGTRMRVSDIVEAIAQGASRDDLLRDFDYLTAQDIAAALVYAARAADHRVIQTA